MLRPASSNRWKWGKTKRGKADLCLFQAANSKVANICSHSQMTLRLFPLLASFLHNHHWATYTGSWLETTGLKTLLLFWAPRGAQLRIPTVPCLNSPVVSVWSQCQDQLWWELEFSLHQDQGSTYGWVWSRFCRVGGEPVSRVEA